MSLRVTTHMIKLSLLIIYSCLLLNNCQAHQQTIPIPVVIPATFGESYTIHYSNQSTTIFKYASFKDTSMNVYFTLGHEQDSTTFKITQSTVSDESTFGFYTFYLLQAPNNSSSNKLTMEFYMPQGILNVDTMKLQSFLSKDVRSANIYHLPTLYEFSDFSLKSIEESSGQLFSLGIFYNELIGPRTVEFDTEIVVSYPSGFVFELEKDSTDRNLTLTFPNQVPTLTWDSPRFQLSKYKNFEGNTLVVDGGSYIVLDGFYLTKNSNFSSLNTDSSSLVYDLMDGQMKDVHGKDVQVNLNSITCVVSASSSSFRKVTTATVQNNQLTCDSSTLPNNVIIAIVAYSGPNVEWWMIAVPVVGGAILLVVIVALIGWIAFCCVKRRKKYSYTNL
ncbi:hypothetical protein C9374_014605 [Naegleria lovaniensis]|uniref:Uncharacterized protein n=1 Tax=Naegleria lovaniensis TaxID=51637 RepID=A0AA88GY63_NAELO|nr:uncharacterized protein C9374_014605 [Naegleria lovaniensis]KAG2389205.1 hypothetical protein C9374_014605 [Naegleria lovaniensis]